MDMEGKVVHVGETEVFGTFQKRLLIIEKEGTNGYKNHYGCQVTGDNVNKFDPINVGDNVTATVFDDSVSKFRENSNRWWPEPSTCMKVHVNSASEAPPASAPADFEESDDQIPFNRD